jgi:hypothetical protein
MSFFSRYCSLALMATRVLLAQDPDSESRSADIRVHSDLVLVNSLVTDRQFRYHKPQ